ncbi:hypothetical protein [Nonomuraea sediminis]|uniref:hypothetical protein n=1 Tax=Nonomuraea sediminis TaxID=2835864 RepID=UPI001BDBCEF1|nr:hypothetical protein [Nonomuraea sediminis]
MAVTQTRSARGSPSKKGFTLELPMVTVQMRAPDLRMPHLEMPHLEMPHLTKQEMGHAVDVARSFLPPPERIAYYGALGALAALGVIEWPVAAAIGVGTMIARREGAGESFHPLQKLAEVLPIESKKETSTSTTPGKSASTTATQKARPAASTTARTKSTSASTATRKKTTSASTTAGKKSTSTTRKRSTSASSATPRRKSAARSTRSSG